MEIYRNACPRNCFASCSMLSYVHNGEIIKVSGDPKHGFNQGRLCAKGYAFTQYVYSPYRLKYPIMQSPRGSGNWKRITWDEAYSIIIDKILELNVRYGSNLACGYNKFSGNLGLLHYAVEGMFNSFGPHTKPVGNPCLISGEQAIRSSFGQTVSLMPEKMADANLIVIWGANPAVTNVHQMKFIFKARQKGAKLVVIDPIFTQTAAKADIYIQVNPGTDGLLAHAIAKILIDSSLYDQEFIDNQTTNWIEFRQYVSTEVNITEVSQETGVSIEVINELANLYSFSKPCVTWIGFGIQRNKNGRENISAINTLAALAGTLQRGKGGVYYAHNGLGDFPANLLNHQGPKHSYINTSREININNFAEEALKLSEPPLKFLWIASRNPLSQDHDFKTWELLFHELELIVTVDLFMTRTAELSDLVLPATTHFEDPDLNISYWHQWLSYNEQAIPAYFESKSDLQIARDLTKKLNELSPNFSNFPYELEPIDWIEREITPSVKELYSLKSYKQLLDGPHLRNDEKYSEGSTSMNFHFVFPKKDALGSEASTNVIEDYDSYPFKLITPQSLLRIHSQYETLSWLSSENDEAIVELSEYAAAKYWISEGEKVEVYNLNGSIAATARINRYLPKKVILVNQVGKNPINQVIVHEENSNIGKSSANFYDSSVNIRKWRD
ncbi:molybdopterin-dependent oxidoreductase [Bacillus sp. FJAT-49705]|uniref:Molybdopterin-dependent oxidoreductase n=1 Tax=Cytobacillus citreus TaxID=2833586 RepID=A0ABS5NUM9_9BACI|nr:molybdopterin-dependent oxidoreductase [Cytobacillus citreus]MBS4191537.1 molybdopterin-dependent oxidoreductase [Cytobacillus citreus]